MSGNSQEWFWTPERLHKLRLILDALSQRDSQGLYFGPIGLVSSVFRRASQEGFDVSYSLVGDGIKILVFLGALERGTPGVKLPGYKRRYYPGKVDNVMAADIQRYRIARGVRSPLPPGRR